MKELRYITFAQMIGCILVIFGHSYPFVTEVPDTLIEVRSFIYLFHMPLFVFCSGYLLSYTNQAERKTFKEYCGQRAKKLLLPYIILSFIGVIPKYLFSSFLNDSIELNLSSLIRAFLVPRENIWGHFWFLPMIFFMGCIAYLIDRYVMKKDYKIIGWGGLTIFLMLLDIVYHPMDSMKWFGINDLVEYGWSYALGVECSYLFGDIKSRFHLSNLKVTIVCLCVGMPMMACLYNYISSSLLHIVMAVSMIIIILLLCITCHDKFRVNRNYIATHTYNFFVLSWPCQVGVEIALELVLHLQWWIIMAAVFISGIIGPFVLLKLIEAIETKTSTHYLSLIIGK